MDWLIFGARLPRCCWKYSHILNFVTWYLSMYLSLYLSVYLHLYFPDGLTYIWNQPTSLLPLKYNRHFKLCLCIFICICICICSLVTKFAASYIVFVTKTLCVRCDTIIVAWVTRPEGPKGTKDEVKQACKLEVGAQRAPRLLWFIKIGFFLWYSLIICSSMVGWALYKWGLSARRSWTTLASTSQWNNFLPFLRLMISLISVDLCICSLEWRLSWTTLASTSQCDLTMELFSVFFCTSWYHWYQWTFCAHLHLSICVCVFVFVHLLTWTTLASTSQWNYFLHFLRLAALRFPYPFIIHPFKICTQLYMKWNGMTCF